MNSIFETVKASVSVPDVAACYGLDMNHSNMICCIFHPDLNLSMKLYDDHYYCFGCHECGDVIDFTAKLFDISPLKAAEKLAADFGLVPPPEGSSGEETLKIRIPQQDETLMKHVRLLSDYKKMLHAWAKVYAPASLQVEEWSIRYTFACSEIPWIEYMNDCINSPDEHMRNWADRELTNRLLYNRMERLLSIWQKEVLPDGTDGEHAA